MGGWRSRRGRRRGASSGGVSPPGPPHRLTAWWKSPALAVAHALEHLGWAYVRLHDAELKRVQRAAAIVAGRLRRQLICRQIRGGVMIDDPLAGLRNLQHVLLGAQFVLDLGRQRELSVHRPQPFQQSRLRSVIPATPFGTVADLQCAPDFSARRDQVRNPLMSRRRTGEPAYGVRELRGWARLSPTGATLVMCVQRSGWMLGSCSVAVSRSP